MPRVVLAIANEKLNASVRSILEKSAVEIRVSCRSGMETIRAVRRMGGGVVITQSRLPDMTAAELSRELSGSAFFLILDRPYTFAEFTGADIFTVPLPVRSGELAGSLKILLQMDERRAHAQTAPTRTEEEKQLILQAKEVIMEKSAMTEEQAYRFLQKRSMETSTAMAEVARMILSSFA